MQRSKTQRRRAPPTPSNESPPGPFLGDTVVKTTEDTLDALFQAETTATFHQPWQKLDRGSRLDRLRKFVQAYPDLSPAERASLLTAVLQAFELRQLNTKVAVEYDPITASIENVRGLRERITPSGFKTFRIENAAIRATQKRKTTGTSAATGTPDSPQLPPS